MKKLGTAVLVAVLAFGMPAAASAQGIAIGAKAGLNLANLGGDGLEGVDTSMKTGLSLGGFMNVGLSPMFSIRPELLFSQKGASYTEGPIEVEQKTSYIEIPVLARLSFGVPAAPLRPVVFAGPSFGLLLSAEAEMGELSGDIKDETKSFDLGAVVGAGLDFGNLSVDARYGLGLSSISDVEDAPDIKNRAISISVGYILPIGL